MAASLNDILDQALRLNPEVQAQLSQESVLNAQQEAAGRWLPDAPALSVAGQSDQWHRDDGQREWEVELEAPLWRAGQRQAGLQAVETQRAQWTAERDALRLKIAGELRDALWTLLENEAQLRSDEARLSNGETLEQDVARRVAAGELAKADLLLVQGETLAIRNRLENAQQSVLTARAQWRLMTGDSRLPEPLAETLWLGDKTHGDENARLQAHPSMVAAQQAVALTRARWQVAQRSQSAPTAAVRWVNERDTEDDDYRQQVGLKVSIPLGAAARNRPAVAEAQWELMQAEAQQQNLRRDLQKKLLTTAAAIDAARRQRDYALRQSDLAQQNLILSKRAFAAGEMDLLSLLKLQSTTLDAMESKEVQALAYQRAVAEHNQALGVLP